VFCYQVFVKPLRRPAPKSKYQFNGLGGLRTHISFMRVRSFPMAPGDRPRNHYVGLMERS
jgi:hypothetical protein